MNYTIHSLNLGVASNWDKEIREEAQIKTGLLVIKWNIFTILANHLTAKLIFKSYITRFRQAIPSPNMLQGANNRCGKTLQQQFVTKSRKENVWTARQMSRGLLFLCCLVRVVLLGGFQRYSESFARPYWSRLGPKGSKQRGPALHRRQSHHNEPL